MNKTRKKRLLSILLVLCMALSMVPMTVFAAGPGSSANNPVVCNSFASFKKAMENQNVTYVELSGGSNVNEVIPSPGDGLAAIAIMQTGPKVLTISGYWTLSAPAGGSFENGGLIANLIGVRDKLVVKGDGTLIYKGAANDQMSAILYSFNRNSDITVEGTVTLKGDANGVAFGRAIYVNHGNLNIKGGFFEGHTTISKHNVTMDAVAIGHNAKATISGGRFLSDGPDKDKSRYYGLSLNGLDTDNNNVKLKGGEFQGIYLHSSKDSKDLDDYIETGFKAQVRSGFITIVPVDGGTTKPDVIPDVITKIEITDVTAPVNGAKPVLTYTIPAGAKYEVNGSAYWHDLTAGGPMGAGDTFVDGQTYYFVLPLKTIGSATFDPNVTATVDDENGSVNYFSKNSVRVEHVFVATGGSTTASNIITKIEITDVTVPVGGANPVPTYTIPAGAKYEVNGSAYWHDYTEGRAMGDGDTFVDGQTYYFMLPLKTIGSATFDSNVTATIDGKKANINPTNDYYLRVECTFAATDGSTTVSDVITEIEITDVTAPVGGENPVLTYTIPAGAKYEVNGSAYWHDLTAGGPMDTDDTFVDGQTYYFMLPLKTIGSATFDPNVTATVDGENDSVNYFGENSVRVEHAFVATGGSTTASDVITKIEIIDVIEPVGGKMPNSDFTLPAGAKYEVNGSAYWHDYTEGRAMGDGDTFVDGQTYYFVLPLKTVDSAAFDSNVTATVDGKKADINPTNDYCLRVECAFTATGTGVKVLFDDVLANDWFANPVMWAYENGLMVGTGAKTFSPHVDTTRGMIVTILHRMENSPEAKASGFNDVVDNTWYSGAVAWAAEQKIVSGYGDGRFGPDDFLTREQLVTILYNYSRSKKYNITADQGLNEFSDEATISDYAKTAMQWAVKHGIITGIRKDLLSPTTTATRAQMATMLQRYIETFVK